MGARASQLYDEVKILRDSGALLTNVKSALLTKHLQKVRELLYGQEVPSEQAVKRCKLRCDTN